MKKNSNKGFTLIELLVVIAIIGILSSVVLASLTTARQKGNDAAIKTSLANMRAQAEILYGGQGVSTYGVAQASSTGCTAANTTLFGTSSTGTLLQMVNGVNAMVGSKTRCASSASSWAFMASTSDSTIAGWCVDSTGNTVSMGALEGFKDNLSGSITCK